jgi:hypothetical protein
VGLRIVEEDRDRRSASQINDRDELRGAKEELKYSLVTIPQLV